MEISAATLNPTLNWMPVSSGHSINCLAVDKRCCSARLIE